MLRGWTLLVRPATRPAIRPTTTVSAGRTITTSPNLLSLVPHIADSPGASSPSPLLPSPDKPLLQRDIHDISLRSLLAANLHLGHNTTLWNPSMLPYIYGSRHGTHIINLEHTLAHLRRAAAFVREVAMANGCIVFLGTKPSIHKVVVDAALMANAYYITKWVGGTITNKERVLRHSTGFDPSKILQDTSGFISATHAVTDDEVDQKKSRSAPPPARGSSHRAHPTQKRSGERASPTHDDSLSFSTSSRASSSHVRRQPHVHTPDVLIVFDYINNLWAVREANAAHIPVIAICDTNTDPTLMQYPIPANDDSVAGIKLIAGVLAAASREGQHARGMVLQRDEKLRQAARR
ncbi:hypothetical protein BASA61_003306 [Batrachochytrium salamandrivorans]|nr:hypothetical protein BASA61_003306 [Batrachochytrium salamandrivorans]